jgi:predicted porin
VLAAARRRLCSPVCQLSWVLNLVTNIGVLNGVVMKRIWLVCMLAACAAPVLADGFYVAADVGRFRWADANVSAADTAFSLAGGYQFKLPFKDRLALEVGYRNLGGMEWDNGLASNKVELSALQFSVLAKHLLNEQVSFYGRLGYADVKISAAAEADALGSASNDKLFGGIGARYALSSKLGVYLEYDKYEKIGAVKLSGVLLGLDYQF